VRRRIAIASKVFLIVSFVGLFASIPLNAFVLDEFDAYGEVPIPGTGTLHLPAGDVTISFHSVYPEGADTENSIPIPEGLEVTITPPRGVLPVTLGSANGICDSNTDTDEGRCRVKVAHIRPVTTPSGRTGM
jgi:hypothetical protein